MKALQTVLLVSTLLCPVVANAEEMMGLPVFRDPITGAKGEVVDIGWYRCPKVGDCAVTITVAKSLIPGKACTVGLTVAGGTKEFFFIDRHEDRADQDIVWTLAAPSGWTATFVTGSGKNDLGISFTEGGDTGHVDTPKSADVKVQRRNIKKNKNDKARRSLLLYNIDVILTNGSETIPCNYGPGIINRG